VHRRWGGRDGVHWTFEETWVDEAVNPSEQVVKSVHKIVILSVNCHFRLVPHEIARVDFVP